MDMYTCIILCIKHFVNRRMDRAQQNEKHNDTFFPSIKKCVAKEGLLGDENASSLSSVSVGSVDICSCILLLIVNLVIPFIPI